MEPEEETRALTAPNSPKELDEVVSSLKFGKFHLKMLILTCGAYFAACAEMMSIVFLSKPVKDEWDLDDMIFPLLPFCCGIVSLVSNFTFGSVSDKFGRQKPLLAALVLVSVFGVACAFAPYFSIFVIMRALVSAGTSGIETVNFVLLLEFLPRKKRGCTMVVITLCGTLGAVFTAAVAWVLLPRLGWRYFIAACSVPAFVVLIYRLGFNYESPRFLYISGRQVEGNAVLAEIAKQNNTTFFSGEIRCPSSGQRGRVQDLFSKELRQQSIFASLVWFMQSMGFWAVTMYLPEYMGGLGMDVYFIMVTVFVGEIPGMCLAMILIEPHMFGRIRCLRFFSAVTATFLILFAFINLDFLKAVFVVVVYCFMAPLYSILNTFTPEVYPTDSRSIAMAWVYIVTSVPNISTAFIGASVLSTNITWLYPTLSAAFFTLQFLFTFGLGADPSKQGLNDTKGAVSRFQGELSIEVNGITQGTQRANESIADTGNTANEPEDESQDHLNEQIVPHEESHA